MRGCDDDGYYWFVKRARTVNRTNDGNKHTTFKNMADSEQPASHKPAAESAAAVARALACLRGNNAESGHKESMSQKTVRVFVVWLNAACMRACNTNARTQTDFSRRRDMSTRSFAQFKSSQTTSGKRMPRVCQLANIGKSSEYTNTLWQIVRRREMHHQPTRQFKRERRNKKPFARCVYGGVEEMGDWVGVRAGPIQPEEMQYVCNILQSNAIKFVYQRCGYDAMHELC